MASRSGILRVVAALIAMSSMHAVNCIALAGDPAFSNGVLRIVGGESSRCGRVEVYYDRQWGTVCDDKFGLNDGDAICKQLGYPYAESTHSRAYFGMGAGPIWLDNLGCHSEASSIMDCRHNGWGVHNCKHKEDAGVCCYRVQPPKPLSLPVRLRCPKCNEGGFCRTCFDVSCRTHLSSGASMPQIGVRGIVEVQVNGQWGPVSAKGWGREEARVVCGELGYPVAHSTLNIADIWPDYNSTEEGSGTRCGIQDITETESLQNSLNYTYLQGVECKGKESKLLRCYFSGIGLQLNPTHEVAVVQCGYLPDTYCGKELNQTYRLRGGAVPWRGRVEVRMNGEWGTICNSGFDEVDASIICRSLGYGTVNGVYSFGSGFGKVHLTRLMCSGLEHKIENCSFDAVTRQDNCGHQRDVGVDCNIPISSCTPTDNDIKMLEHRDSTGYVRTYPTMFGLPYWALLCYSDTLMDVNVGKVICRQTKGLFLGRISKGKLPTNYRGSYYSGSIRCKGDEMSISQCTTRMVKVLWCLNGYARVDCSSLAPDLVPDPLKMKLSLEGRFYIDHLPMYYLDCAAEENCLSRSAYAPGLSTSDERYLLRFDSLTWNWGISEFLPVIPRYQWVWHECHKHYHSMENFAEYHLLNKQTGARVTDGHKASFCLEDSQCIRGYYTRFTCSTRQGISPNCGDLYGNHLECQWIDVTGVSSGNYLLQVIINPTQTVVESDYRNNMVLCNLTLYENPMSYDTHDCWLSDHEGTPAVGFG